MALATLSIDLEAKTASLQAGLDQATRLAQKNAADMKAAFDSVGAQFQTIVGLFAGAISFHAIESLISGAIDAQDHLNDLSKASQLTVEQIGGLGFAASQAGGDVDSITGAVGKLNLSIAKATAGNKEAVGVFNAIGVSFKDASGNARDAVSVFSDVATKFASYSDGPEKAALGNALFGKSYQGVMALLADGGDALLQNIAYFNRFSGVTAETASAADQFNDTLGKLKLIQQGVAANLANELLPSLQQLADLYLQNKEAGNQFKGAASDIADILKGVGLAVGVAVIGFVSLGKAVGGLVAEVSALAHLDLKSAQFISKESLADIDAAKDKVKALYDAIYSVRKAGTPGKTTDAAEFALLDQVTPGKKAAPSLPQKDDNTAAKTQAIDSYIKKLNEQVIAIQTAGGSYETYNKTVLQLATEPKLASASAAQKAQLLDLAKQIDVLTHGYDAYADANKRAAEASAEADQYVLDQARDFKKLIDATPTAQLEATRAVQLKLAEAFQAGYFGATDSAAAIAAYGEAAQTALGTLPQDFKKATTGMQDLAINAAQEIDGYLGTGLHDLLSGNFSDIGKDFGKMLENIVAQALQANISKALFGGFSQGEGFGGLITEIFPSLTGVGARAGGGSVQPMSLTRVNENGPEGLSIGGKDYLMTGDKGGKVYSADSGSGGGGPQIVFQIASGVTRNELAALVPQIKAQVKAEIADTNRRPGGSS